MLAVQQLLDKLNSGRIPISPEMLDGKAGVSKTSYQQGSVKVRSIFFISSDLKPIFHCDAKLFALGTFCVT